MNILGIETSCDETAIAVVADGRRVLSNIVASQMAEHARYGGVVPEVASRRHVELINGVLRHALSEAGVTLAEIDAIAVTNRPGLLGALLVGVTTAKALAQARNLPLMGVHHIEAHLYANFLTHPNADFPAVALVVSGGHTDLFHLRGHGDYALLGRTRDDAAGEAFDKCARLMGLEYPGGPAIQKAAETGNPKAVPLPRAWLDGTFEFSFSGLKTAVRRVIVKPSPPLPPSPCSSLAEGGGRPCEEEAISSPVALLPPPSARDEQGEGGRGGEGSLNIPDLAASFQEAVVDVLVGKTLKAAQATGVSRVFMAGGVAANKRLRERMQEACDKAGLALFYPPLALCTDNGAMIAATGYYHFMAGKRDDLSLSTFASEPLATRTV